MILAFPLPFFFFSPLLEAAAFKTPLFLSLFHMHSQLLFSLDWNPGKSVEKEADATRILSAKFRTIVEKRESHPSIHVLPFPFHYPSTPMGAFLRRPLNFLLPLQPPAADTPPLLSHQPPPPLSLVLRQEQAIKDNYHTPQLKLSTSHAPHSSALLIISPHYTW